MSFYTDIYFLSVIILLQNLHFNEAEKCQIAYCQHCKSSQECAVCEFGRFGSKCEYKCQADNFTCSMCKDTFLTGLMTKAECYGCQKNEYLFQDKCLQCPDTCVSCVYQEDCNECSDEFVETNCSNDCPKKCLNCSSHLRCTSCKAGWSGRSCQCSFNCARLGIDDDWCDINGACLKGCHNNKTGIKCNIDCPKNNKCLQCDQMNGHCLLCSYGFYGNSCNNVCGHCQPNNEGYIRCNISNGECNGTCMKSYYGRHCDKRCAKCLPDERGISECDFDTGNCNACIDGFYGKRCDKKCGHCQADEQSPIRCEMETGKCLNGCVDGFCGSLCDKIGGHLLNNTDVVNCEDETVELNVPCKDGFFGQFCDQKCPQKCSDPLTNTNKCAGISGNCTFGCTPGRYGDLCEKTCSNTCLNMTCNQQTGECSDGCVIGWYGENCQYTCSKKCLNGICDNYSASCSNGCVPGWYGVTCNKTCQAACFNGSCNQHGGQCDYGCIAGFYGNNCENICNDNCENNMCDSEQKCSFGCKSGFLGPFCNVTQTSDTNVSPLLVGIIGGAAASITLFVFLVIIRLVVRMVRLKSIRRKRVCRHDKAAEDNTVSVYDEIDDTILEENFMGEGFRKKLRRKCDRSCKQISYKRTLDSETGIYDLPTETKSTINKSMTVTDFDIPARTFQTQALDIHTTLSDNSNIGYEIPLSAKDIDKEPFSNHFTACHIFDSSDTLCDKTSLCSNSRNVQANEYMEFVSKESTKVKGIQSTSQTNLSELKNQEATTCNSFGDRNSCIYLHPIS